MFVGDNKDYYFSSPSMMWFVPAVPGAYGRVCFGWYGSAQGGMNDHGLFIDWALNPQAGKIDSGKPAFEGGTERILATCANVDDVVKIFEKYVRGENFSHCLIADRMGNSVVGEWVNGEFKAVRKKGRYQIITNFLLSNPQLGNFPCQRYTTVSQILDQYKTPSVEACVAALKDTAQITTNFETKYSQVYDLVHGDVYIYYRHNFDKVIRVNLTEELQKGLREIDLKVLFEKGPGVLSPPEIITGPSISPKDLLQKALDARGGREAATNIRAFRAVGELNLAGGDTGLVWITAARPLKYFASVDLNEKLRIEKGFDGQIAWEARSGVAPERLTGKELQECQEDAEFFGWYDNPENYQTLGKVTLTWFAGQKVYELKLKHKSGKETAHYYNTTNYLLTGIVESADTPTGPTWLKVTFDDYQTFGGFQFPTWIHEQSEEKDLVIRISSLQVNNVEDSEFEMPKNILPPAAEASEKLSPQEDSTIKLNAGLYDAYVGTYKLAPGVYLTVSKRDGRLWIQASRGQSNVELQPESETNSFRVEPDGTVTFVKNNEGQVIGLILHQNGQRDQAADKIYVKVDSHLYDTYVGQYQLEESKPNVVLTIRRQGDRLTVDSGQFCGEIMPESKTNFFDPMSGMEYMFVRDGRGKVTHLILRNENITLKATKCSDQLPKIDLQDLSAYTGRYEFSPDVPLTISLGKDRLKVQWLGSGMEIFPASETEFYSGWFNAQFTFVKNDKGDVISLILHQGGLNPVAKKIH